MQIHMHVSACVPASINNMNNIICISSIDDKYNHNKNNNNYNMTTKLVWCSG